MIKVKSNADRLELLSQRLLKQPCFKRPTLLALNQGRVAEKISCVECKNPCKEYKLWHSLLTISFTNMKKG